MSHDVVVLRPEADFVRAGAMPPDSLNVTYCSPDDAGLPAVMRKAHALVIPAVGPKLSPALFEGSVLKLVQVTGAGLDRLDESTLKRLNVAVANVPGGSNSALAEYTVTAASMLLRRLAWADAEIRNGNYDVFRRRMLADNLAGINGLLVGVVGLGVIGQAVAQAFHRMDGRIVYYDPALRGSQFAATLGANFLPLDELLRTADVITLHVPLIDATRGMIGASQFGLMKQNAILINAARGGVVDEAALAAHLGAGRLGGAAVDVYSTEPPQADNPLLTLSGDAARRLLLTPHIAGVTRQSAAYLFRSAWGNVERVLLKGEPPAHRVY